MNNLITTLELVKLKEIPLSADAIVTKSLISAIDNLDNRLSDVTIAEDPTEE